MTEWELLSKARAMREFSYAPYSHFAVGAALEADDGSVYTGCNVENAAYGSSICAERTALLKAVSCGARQFRRIAIVGSGPLPCWPCGACRQMLYEFAPDLEILVGNGAAPSYETTTLSALLPQGFGPTQLHGHD